jgi:hypothetical protein
MVTADVFQMLFESSIKRSEKKVAGPTVSLLKKILANAGMDEGEWSLRDSRRIKKKGRERFHAIRIEERSGRKSIRVWCKPAGNDSCFEYTLLPPAEVDTQALFGLLRRVNPVNLRIPESNDLPRAFINHVIDAAPKIIPLAPALGAEKEEEAEERDDLGSEAEAEIREAVQDLDQLEKGAEMGQIAEALSPPKESVRSKLPLHIDEPVLMSDQEVMDKALVAIGIVAPNGYAKKKEASDSIIKRLGIKEFIRDVSGGTYTSVEGAMRALTMALRGAGYIERVHYTSEDGSISNGIKGYKLTTKGLKRIQSLSGEMKPFESVAIEKQAETAVADDPRESLGSESAEPFDRQEAGLNSEDLPRLKSLISQHEDADLQLKEIEGILGNLDSEIADIGLDVTGLELAEREKMKQMEILRGEIQRIMDKKASAAEKLERKRRERREWEEMKSPHISEKARVETEICAITGRNKT